MKSKLLTFPGGRFNPRDEDERARYAVYALHRRAAEAAGIRSHVTELLTHDPQAAVVVAGDLYDEPHAATTQILHGPPGSEVGTGGFDQPDAGDSQRLWNTAPFIAEDERWSRVYRARRELIDHVLCSHALIHAVQGATTGGLAVESIEDRPGSRRSCPHTSPWTRTGDRRCGPVPAKATPRSRQALRRRRSPVRTPLNPRRRAGFTQAVRALSLDRDPPSERLRQTPRPRPSSALQARVRHEGGPQIYYRQNSSRQQPLSGITNRSLPVPQPAPPRATP